MNKIFYLILIYIICLSCASFKKKKCSILCDAFKKTTQQDFFLKYREKGSLNVVVKNKGKTLELKKCSRFKNITVDTIQKVLRYVKLEEYRHVDNIVRLQIGCYDEIKEPYNVLYSTSYKVLNNKTLVLNKESSPYIDTLQTKKVIQPDNPRSR